MQLKQLPLLKTDEPPTASIYRTSSNNRISGAIRAGNLTKTFDELTAVDSVSFEVQPGEIFGYLGPNGCGKTTTIHLLLGLISPTAGRSTVLGYDTRSDGTQIREKSGALLEHSGVYEQLTAEDNLEFYARAWQIPPGLRGRRIEELLKSCGLWSRRTDRVGSWSRGMKQQLALARVLLHRPQLVFLDEPTAGLDVVAANRVRSNIEQIVTDQGVTVFLTTHNLAEAERLCDRVAVVRDGRILTVSTPDELKRRSSTPTLHIDGSGFTSETVSQLEARADVAIVELGERHLALTVSESADRPAIVRLLVDSGASVEEVRTERATLEDAFLRMLEREEEADE